VTLVGAKAWLDAAMTEADAARDGSAVADRRR
jgi:hypothetical protein